MASWLAQRPLGAANHTCALCSGAQAKMQAANGLSVKTQRTEGTDSHKVQDGEAADTATDSRGAQRQNPRPAKRGDRMTQAP